MDLYRRFSIGNEVLFGNSLVTKDDFDFSNFNLEGFLSSFGYVSSVGGFTFSLDIVEPFRLLLNDPSMDLASFSLAELVEQVYGDGFFPRYPTYRSLLLDILNYINNGNTGSCTVPANGEGESCVYDSYC